MVQVQVAVGYTDNTWESLWLDVDETLQDFDIENIKAEALVEAEQVINDRRPRREASFFQVLSVGFFDYED